MRSLIAAILLASGASQAFAGYCQGQTQSGGHTFHYRLKVVGFDLSVRNPVSLEIFYDGNPTPPVSLRTMVADYTWGGATSTGKRVVVTYDNANDEAFAIQHNGKVVMCYCR